MKKLKAIFAIIFSSEYFVVVSNNLHTDILPTTFSYYINTNRKLFTVAVKGFLENILSR